MDTILQRWSIHLQATDFYMMIDTDQGAHMLDDLPHSILDILNWYYPTWKTHQHLDAFTSRECSPLVLTPHPRSTRYGLCCANSSYPSRASFRLRQRDLPDYRLDPETNSCQTGKENRDSSRNRGIFIYEIHLYYHHYYSPTSSSFELGGKDL